MAILHPPLPPPPQPIRKTFDPFNSSSTGHQRAENRLSGSPGWRDSRVYKLGHQLRDTSGGGGDQHRADLVGAGCEHFRVEGRKDNGDWERGALGLRGHGWQDIRTVFNCPREARDVDKGDDIRGAQKKARHDQVMSITIASQKQSKCLYMNGKSSRSPSTSDHTTDPPTDASVDSVSVKTYPSEFAPKPRPAGRAQIFVGLTIYINGSTAPLVSDHRLKQLLAQHGANVFISLGRRTVTHVILGEKDKGGGSLAAGKLQKEVARIGGKGLKYVGARWVLESIKFGKRLPEVDFQVVHLAQRGQKSVYGMFEGAKQEAKQNAGTSKE